MTNKPNDVRVSRKKSEIVDTLPGLIKTLHSNGEKICAEATIAQQAEHIKNLESELKRLRTLLAQPAEQQGEPVAWQYKEYVWATGLQASVWRDKLESEQPDPEAQEIKDLIPLYRHAQPATAKVDERLTEATAFVQKLCDAASGQPSVATGYLSDILDVLQGRSKLNTPQ